MPPPPIPSTTKNPGRPRRAILILAGIIVFIILLGATLLIGRHLSLSAKIKAKLSQIRTANEPTNTQELDSYYKQLPPDTNSLKFYTEAFASLRKIGSRPFLETVTDLPEGTNALPDDLRQPMQKAVNEGGPALETLRKAATFGPCHFPIDYTGGFFALMPHLADLRVCGKLEICNGVLKEQSGDTDGAIQSVAIICKYAKSLDGEPDLISVLVQEHLNVRACDLSLWILNHQILSPKQLAALQAGFKDAEPTNWVDRAVIGERAAMLAAFDYSPSDLADIITAWHRQPSDLLAIRFVRLLGQSKKDKLTYMDRMDEIRETARLSFPEGPDRVEALIKKIENEARSKMLITTGDMLPPFVRSIYRNAEQVARLRIIRTAIAIEQYRTNHGVLPPNLVVLKPNDPETILDPFDGKELRYVHSGNGYTLYSIGPDGVDDEGLISVPLISKEKNVRGDITATVRR